MDDLETIKEINLHIKDGLTQWSNICLTADADNWSYNLDYDANDVLSVTELFMHVCSNIGIKKGLLDEKGSEESGAQMRALVKRMTGFDTYDIVENLKKKEMDQ